MSFGDEGKECGWKGNPALMVLEGRTTFETGFTATPGGRECKEAKDWLTYSPDTCWTGKYKMGARQKKDIMTGKIMLQEG